MSLREYGEKHEASLQAEYGTCAPPLAFSAAEAPADTISVSTAIAEGGEDDSTMETMNETPSEPQPPAKKRKRRTKKNRVSSCVSAVGQEMVTSTPLPVQPVSVKPSAPVAVLPQPQISDLEAVDASSGQDMSEVTADVTEGQEVGNSLAVTVGSNGDVSGFTNADDNTTKFEETK